MSSEGRYNLEDEIREAEADVAARHLPRELGRLRDKVKAERRRQGLPEEPSDPDQNPTT